jgi:hypothetical protein
MKHAIYIPVYYFPLLLNPWKPKPSPGVFFCSKAGLLSAVKNILTYHFVALYLFDQHYTLIMRSPYTPLRAGVALRSFLKNLIKNFKILAVQLAERQNGLLVEAIQDLLKNEGKDETIRS